MGQPGRCTAPRIWTRRRKQQELAACRSGPRRCSAVPLVQLSLKLTPRGARGHLQRSRPLLALPSASVSQRASRALDWLVAVVGDQAQEAGGGTRGAAAACIGAVCSVQCVPVLPASDRLLLSRQTDNQPVKEGEPLRLA